MVPHCRGRGERGVGAGARPRSLQVKQKSLQPLHSSTTTSINQDESGPVGRYQAETTAHRTVSTVKI